MSDLTTAEVIEDLRMLLNSGTTDIGASLDSASDRIPVLDVSLNTVHYVNPADLGGGGGASLPNPGTANAAIVSDGAAGAEDRDEFLIDSSGHVTVQNTSDSTTAFQVLDADGGTPILNIDSTNERVGIGTSTPDSALHIAGTNSQSGGLKIEGASVDRFAIFGLGGSSVELKRLAGGIVRFTDNSGNVDLDIRGGLFGFGEHFSGAVPTGRIHVYGSNQADSTVQQTRDQANNVGCYHIYEKRRSGGVPNANDYSGGPMFTLTDAGGVNHIYASIWGQITNVGSGTEAGAIIFTTATGGAIGIPSTGGSGEVARIDENGDILQGTPTSPTGTTGVVFVQADNGGDPTPPANSAARYSKDVAGTTECFDVDEAGNATQTTSHPADAPEAMLDDFEYIPLITKTQRHEIGEVHWIHGEKLVDGQPWLIRETFADYNARMGLGRLAKLKHRRRSRRRRKRQVVYHGED